MFAFTREAVIIAGFPIHYYGIVIALGVYLAVCLAEKREAAFGFQKDTVLSLALFAIPVAVVCARIYYVLFEFDEYRHNLISIFDIRSGGMAIYGGLIGGVLTGFVFSEVRKISFLRLADLAAPSIAFGQALGRWGNFFNQEAYGVKITRPALQFFPLAVYIEHEGAHFAATFFYESFWCLLIVCLCLIFEKKHLFRFKGAEISFYAAMYAFERMLVEGLRTDSLYLGSIRVSQLLSAVCLFAAALSVIFMKSKTNGKRAALLITASFAFAVVCLSLSGMISNLFLLPAGGLILIIVLREIFS